MKKLTLAAFAVIAIFSCVTKPAHADCGYPADWWKPVPQSEAASWEILPQAASCEKGDVILSKRTELGVFSNLSPSPFTFHNLQYGSVEGFWQSLKYPENDQDPRMDPKVTWKYTRDQVRMMSGFDAKGAGDQANANMTKLGIKWVSFEGQQFEYRGDGQPHHYELIYAVTQEKVNQNPAIKDLLTKTGNLILKPDHNDANANLPSYQYYTILMKIRDGNK